MAKFDIDELVGALFAANLAVLDGLVAQGAVDKPALLRHINGILVQESPVYPAAQFVLSRIVHHLQNGQSPSKATLQ